MEMMTTTMKETEKQTLYARHQSQSRLTQEKRGARRRTRPTRRDTGEDFKKKKKKKKSEKANTVLRKLTERKPETR